MKRKSIKILFITVIMVLSSSMLVMGSQKSNMEQFLKYCKEGNFKVAKKYAKKLPKYANEKCVKKMSKKKKDKLKESTESWLAKIDEKAQKQASDFEGGSAYSSVYVEAKSAILKKRIKWMIKNYKDVGCKM